MGRIGSMAGASLGRGRGSGVVAGSMGMWITATIRGMDIVGRRRSEAIGRSTTSRAMKLGMDEGTQVLRITALPVNTALELSAADAAAYVAAAGAAGTR